MTTKFCRKCRFFSLLMSLFVMASAMAAAEKPFAWGGTYRLSNYQIVLKPEGKGFDISVFSASMIPVKYKAKGVMNRDGKIEAYFDRGLSPNLNPKYYQKGKHLFSLEANSDSRRRNVILSWIKDDGSRSKGFTLVRDSRP